LRPISGERERAQGLDDARRDHDRERLANVVGNITPPAFAGFGETPIGRLGELIGAIALPFAISQFSHDGWTVAAQAHTAVSLEEDDLDLVHHSRSSLRIALRTSLQTERRAVCRSGS